MSVQNITDAEFENFIKNNGSVIIKYYADWCGSCRLISPVFKRLSDAAGNEGVVFIEINAETNPMARKWAGVSNLPYFAAIKNGVLIHGDNFAKEERITEFINELK